MLSGLRNQSLRSTMVVYDVIKRVLCSSKCNVRLDLDFHCGSLEGSLAAKTEHYCLDPGQIQHFVYKTLE